MTDPIIAVIDLLSEYTSMHPQHDTDDLVHFARQALSIKNSPTFIRVIKDKIEKENRLNNSQFIIARKSQS